MCIFWGFSSGVAEDSVLLGYESVNAKSNPDTEQYIVLIFEG